MTGPAPSETPTAPAPGARGTPAPVVHEVVATTVAEHDVVRSGTPGGPPAVLVPGLADGRAPLSEHDVRPFFATAPRFLAAHEVHALSHPRALTQPGSAGAARPTTPELAAAVAAYLERLDRPVVLLGHSLGGMVAQHVAALAPESVAALVLSCCPARLLPAQREVLRAWAALLRAGDVRGHDRAVREVGFPGPEQQGRRDLLAAAPTRTVPHLLDRHLALTHACLTHDGRAALPGVSAPTLVIGGARDRLARPDQLIDLARRVARGSVWVHPDAGHGLPEQEPDAVAARVATFLADPS